MRCLRRCLAILVMTDTSGILAALAAALLFASLTAWLKLTGRVSLRRLDGRTVNPQDLENASRLLTIAFGVSAVAAVLALVGLLFR
jgi:hypothetical protein